MLFTAGFAGSLQSQCVINGKRNACVNDLVGFTVSSSSGSISSWSWNFGSYGSSSNANPTVKFTAEATLTISCTATLSSGGTCSDTHTIVIRANPKASLYADPGNKYCFNGNKICLINTSTPAKTGLSSLSLLWGDGYIYNTRAPLPNGFCHQYTDTGKFKINLEIADSFGCKDVYSTTVRIKPGITVKAASQMTNYCDSVKFCFIDQSTGAAPISRKWIDRTNRKTLGTGTPHCMTVKPGDELDVVLISTNREGCADSTFIQEKAPLNKLFIENKRASYCMNEIESGQVTLYANESVNWNVNGTNLGRASFMKITSGLTGWNKITISQTTPCPLTFTDSILIRTVRARGRHYNITRPGVQDTALFLDLTPRPPGSRLMKIWQFNDWWAPPCTTWTRAKINAGLNCNFSRDSIGQHFYSRPGCYGARLFVYDSATGCFDDTVFNVYRDDSCERTFTPMRVCLGDGIDFRLSRPSWFSVYRNNYLLTDITKPRDSFVLTNIPRRYVYTTPGPKSPVLARFYGPDSHWVLRSGKIIFDTLRPGKGWDIDTMKNLITVVPKPDPRFNATVISRCAPFLVRIDFKDSVLTDPKNLSIDWGDTIMNFNTGTGPVYRLNPVEHTYSRGGTYIITVVMKNRTDCVAQARDTVRMGWQMSFMHEESCGGRICINDSVSSFGSSKKWSSSNPEGKLVWNWGDGSIDTAFSPCHQYTAAGKYNVVLTAIGNDGCVQTQSREISFTRPVAAIRFQPLIYCSEIRQYFDSSYIQGPAGADVIEKWRWDFNDGSKPRLVQNPAHIFPAGGTYRVKLVVTTRNGCRDSVYRDMVVLGPVVKASIITDSIGCSPLRVKFANASRNTGTYIWEFGDPGRNFLSTDRDTQVAFTYAKPGVYYAYLTGGDSFFNPTTGSKYYCSVRFPEAGKPQMRITVLPTAKMSFTGPDTLCLNDSAEFTNTTKDTGISAFRWHLGTRTRTEGYGSFRYKFDRTGQYRVMVYPDFAGANNCADTAVKIIHVVALQPSFEWECPDLMTPELRLKNTSDLQADNYRWFRLDPNDSSETLLGVSKDLRVKTDTGTRIICLALNTGAYCTVSYCKTLQIKSGVVLANVFTPGSDGFNDAWEVPLYGYRDFRVTIYNRWGEHIFSSTDPGRKWNGKVENSGPELPDGTYFYVLRYRDLCSNELREVNGSINLIR